MNATDLTRRESDKKCSSCWETWAVFCFTPSH